MTREETKSITVLITIWLLCLAGSAAYVHFENQPKEKPKPPCIETGYTLISGDSAVTNCGRKIAKKHWRP